MSMTRHSTATGKEAFSDSMNWYLSSTLSRRRPWPFLKPPFQSATYELLREVLDLGIPLICLVVSHTILPVTLLATPAIQQAAIDIQPPGSLGDGITLSSNHVDRLSLEFVGVPTSRLLGHEHLQCLQYEAYRGVRSN